MADDFIAKNFNNLPIESLISAPLTAAAHSNLLLANATYEYIKEVWVENGGSSEGANGAYKAKTLQFKVEQLTDTAETVERLVVAPLAALLEAPNLMVRSVDVSFTMEVKDISSSSTTAKADTSLSISGKGLMWDAKLTGTLSASTTQARSTDRSAKYEVRVRADQSEQTEGMGRLAQIFANAVETRGGSKSQK